MNRTHQRRFLEADLAQVEALLARIPTRRVLERIGLESRRDEIIGELKALDKPVTSANVILSFDGEPVANAPGIDSKFAGAALMGFQDLVAALDASRTREVRDTGPIPGEKSSRLRLVGTVHGSFGFELQEVDNPLWPSSLYESVKTATELIAAAGSGDEEFMTAAADVEPRAHEKLVAFLKIVKSAHAVCRVVSDNAEAALLDEASVDAAVERASTTSVEENEKYYEGKFLGVMLESRWFEHETNALGAVITGKVHEDVDRAKLTSWNRELTAKTCIAVVRSRTVSSNGKSTTAYTLLDLRKRGANSDAS
ncbi:hypothetical protein [Sorangium cellulosum]|uniref:hypothetical protein n=1 Tax=Sorangium cellulosum TaxID=56 RepID=UPI000B306F7F|nr:hypothetical protein [Sorangium cellulosum]